MRKFGLLMVALLLALCCAAGLAEERVARFVPGEEQRVSVAERGDDRAAFEGFVQREFGLPIAAPRGTHGLTLGTDSREYQVYLKLAAFAQRVAKGEISETVYAIPYSELYDKLEYTAQELGLNTVIEDEHITDEAKNAFFSHFPSVDLGKVVDALLADYPYDLFWFDKTKGYWWSTPGCGAYAMGDEQWMYIPEGGALTVSFYVNYEYAASGVQETTNFDSAKISVVEAAAGRAKQIVAANAAKSDMDKLKAYKEAICELVDYNHDAADDTKDTPYGNPWQLIWVFDGDPGTKVVCEGYAKAFQWLCDLSRFHTGVEALTVTGDMYGGTGAGRHMWNLVRMGNGKQYLVDVTNCDDGSIGAPDQLFMVGYTGKASDRLVSSDGSEVPGYYYQVRGGEVIYAYDQNTVNLYGNENLTVAQNAFSKNDDPEAYADTALAYTLSPKNPTTADDVTISLGERYERVRVTTLRDGSPLYGGSGLKEYTDTAGLWNRYPGGNYSIAIEALKEGVWYQANVEFTVEEAHTVPGAQTLSLEINNVLTLGKVPFEYFAGEGFDEIAFTLYEWNDAKGVYESISAGTLPAEAGIYTAYTELTRAGSMMISLEGKANGQTIETAQKEFYVELPLIVHAQEQSVTIGETAHFEYEVTGDLYGYQVLAYVLAFYHAGDFIISYAEDAVVIGEEGGTLAHLATAGEQLSACYDYIDPAGVRHTHGEYGLWMPVSGDQFTFVADAYPDKWNVLAGEAFHVDWKMDDSNGVISRALNLWARDQATGAKIERSFPLDSEKAGTFTMEPSAYADFVDCDSVYIYAVFEDAKGLVYKQPQAIIRILSADLYLPGDLTAIESQAFQGVAGQKVYIPLSVQQIADDAFDASVIILCKANSYAYGWAADHGYNSQVVD